MATAMAAAAAVNNATDAVANVEMPSVPSVSAWPNPMGVTNYDSKGCSICMPCGLVCCSKWNRYTTKDRDTFDNRPVVKTCCGGWKEGNFTEGLIGPQTTFSGGIKCCGLCDPYVEVDVNGQNQGKFQMNKPDCKICCCNFLKFGTAYDATGQEMFSEYRQQCMSSCQLNMLECLCNMACLMCGFDCTLPECCKCQECKCKQLCEPLCQCGYVDQEYPLYRPSTRPLPTGFYENLDDFSPDEKIRVEAAQAAGGSGPGMPWATLVHRRHVQCPFCCPDYWGYKRWPAFATDEEKRLLMCAALGRKWKPMS